MSISSRAVFVVALDSHLVLVIPVNTPVVPTTVPLPLFVEYCFLMKSMRYLYLRVSLPLFIFDGLGKWKRSGGERGEVGMETDVFNSIPQEFSDVVEASSHIGKGVYGVPRHNWYMVQRGSEGASLILASLFNQHLQLRIRQA